MLTFGCITCFAPNLIPIWSQSHGLLLIPPMTRTLKRDWTTGGEPRKPTHTLDLMLKAMSDKPHMKMQNMGLPIYGAFLDIG